MCLQETKVADDAFPALTFASIGYESAQGQGQWNGVAVLSKVGLDDVVTNFAARIDPDVDARIITATCAGIRVSACTCRTAGPSTTSTTSTSSIGSAVSART